MRRSPSGKVAKRFWISMAFVVAIPVDPAPTQKPTKTAAGGSAGRFAPASPSTGARKTNSTLPSPMRKWKNLQPQKLASCASYSPHRCVHDRRHWSNKNADMRTARRRQLACFRILFFLSADVEPNPQHSNYFLSAALTYDDEPPRSRAKHT